MTHPNRHPGAGPYTNAPQVAAWFIGRGEIVERRSVALVKHFTSLLELRVKANASGRPGPRVISGDYRRSINGRVRNHGGVMVGSVGTAAPQARRLEYGFVGADRLGRMYNQRPYAHFGPATALTFPEFALAMRRLL